MSFSNFKLWFTDPNRAGLYLLLIILLAATVLAMAADAFCDPPAQQVDTVQRVEKAITWWGRKAPKNPVLKPANLDAMSRAISKNATKYLIPWSLVTSIVLRESSGHEKKAKEKNSKGGELGEMQVHPSNVRRFRCDMSTLDGRIDCGCRVLRHNIDQCGTVRGGMTRYASKYRRCRAIPGTKLAWVVKDRFELAQKLVEVSRD
jgi:hypothetical protein